MRLALVLLLSFPSLGMTCGPAPTPEADSCADPGATPITGLQIGPDQSPDLPFEPWAATDSAIITRGFQGGDMLGVILRVTGAPAPACLAQRTRVSLGGRELQSGVALRTYAEPDGARETRTLWFIFDDAPAIGSELVVQTEAGGQTATSRLTLVEDRHRLLSLTPPTVNPRVGDAITFALVMRHAPEYTPVDLTLESSDPTVLGSPPGTLMLFEDQTTVQVAAVSAGSAELVVRFRDQELRAPVTIEAN